MTRFVLFLLYSFVHFSLVPKSFGTSFTRARVKTKKAQMTNFLFGKKLLSGLCMLASARRSNSIYAGIAITTTSCPENIVILLRYFGWWPYLFLAPTAKSACRAHVCESYGAKNKSNPLK